MNVYKVGLDIGSTTTKMVVLDKDGTTVLFSGYKRHQAKIQECLLGFLYQIKEQLGDIPLSFHITGSVGMGISEKCSLPFVQEVVAATNYVCREHPHTATMIDIGGEDAKVVFFQDGQATDLRMNGNCAGGTGAFIDQMAILLGVSIDELNELALRSNQVYSIASRCGVFCKTDIQNLIAKNISKENIAASIFHAVAVQTTVTLARGCNIVAPVLLCGGPLTFIPALRLPYFGWLQTAYFFNAFSTSSASAVHSLASAGFLFTVFRISAALRKEVTAKKLEGTRNWKVVASSEGRKAEAINPTGFTGLPQPSLVMVSSARSVLRWNLYGPFASSLRCCSLNVFSTFAMACNHSSENTLASPVVFQ